MIIVVSVPVVIGVEISGSQIQEAAGSILDGFAPLMCLDMESCWARIVAGYKI